MKKEKLNGSVALLAKALQGVIEESTQTVVDYMADMESRLVNEIKTLDEKIQTTNENMQLQFSELRNDMNVQIGELR